MMANTWTAVLMAGGKSTRMGRDKAELPWGSGFLWEHQLATLRGLNPERLVLAAGTDVAWRPGEVEWVRDVAPGRGPLAGLTAVLKALQTTHAVVLAVDMPRMTAPYLRGLMARAWPGWGVAPMIGGWCEPLSAVYPREALAEAEAALAGPDQSLQNLILQLTQNGRMQPRPVEPADEELFLNCNEIGDLGGIPPTRQTV